MTPDPARSDPRATLVALVRAEVTAAQSARGRRGALLALAGVPPDEHRERSVAASMQDREIACRDALIAAGVARSRREAERLVDLLLGAVRARALSPAPIPPDFAEAAVDLVLSRRPSD